MKKFLSILIATVLTLTMAGCSKDNPTNEQNEETMKMKYIGLKVYDPVYIALEKGFFDNNGVDIELVDMVAGGATAVQMIEGGDAEAGLLSYMAIVNAVNEGMSITGITDLQSSFDEAPLEEFFVRKDSGINSIEDLKGKKIAINLVKSSFHYTWLMALENAGMSEDDVEWVVLPFEQQALALENGQVDAIGLMSPYILNAKSNENFEKLYDATDIFGERQFCDIIVSTKFAEENPETVKAFVSGITDAMAWVEDNQNEAKEIISKYTGVDPSQIDDYKFQENGEVVMEDAEYWLDYMKEHDSNIKDSVTVEKIATNKYNTKVE